jgi:L-threonylcarbamoyladenylate synthase
LKNTIVVKVDQKRPDKKVLALCGRIVKSGGLVAFPTETVYGLAANCRDASAMKALYRAKGRPKAKPSTVHIADIKAIRKMGCTVTKSARLLIDRFWPGPLTIILPSRSGKTVGFRMPANKAALELIRAAGVPIVAPSANISGKRPPRTAADVLKGLNGRIDAVIDGGSTKVGIESTVVDLSASTPKILREGAVKAKAIFKILCKT